MSDFLVYRSKPVRNTGILEKQPGMAVYRMGNSYTGINGNNYN